jgi:hypothetical protein
MRISLSLKFSALALLASAAFGQYSPASSSPDCYYTEILSTTTRTSIIDNRELSCSVWKVQVLNASNAPIAYTFDRSQDNTTWQTFFTNTIAATTASFTHTVGNSAYVSINLTSKGTGNVIVAISGYNYRSNKNTSSAATPSSVPVTVLNEVASSTITYTGFAKAIFDPNTNTSYAITAIMRVTYDVSGNLTLRQWADGDAEEDNIWANRASLTYK